LVRPFDGVADKLTVDLAPDVGEGDAARGHAAPSCITDCDSISADEV
jgi:hypothetical protein